MLILAILVLGLAAGWVSNLLVGRGEKMSWPSCSQSESRARLWAVCWEAWSSVAASPYTRAVSSAPSSVPRSCSLRCGPSRNDRNVNRCRKQSPSGHTRRSCLSPATASHGAPWDANRDPRCCKSSGSLMSRPAATHGFRAPMAPTRQRPASASSVARRRTHRGAGRPAPPEAD